jgi:diguanylate cyclase (GGDEF)-like protein
MSMQPPDLPKKSDSLHQRWKTFVASPGFEQFVEFAVCISSFSEFLKGKGLSGLHQTAHQLEQRVLALFDDASRAPIPHVTIEALNSGLEALISRVTLFIGTSQRLVNPLTTTSTAEGSDEWRPMPRIWFIGDKTPTSMTLTSQLTDLGVNTENHALNTLPPNSVGPQILVLNVGAMALDQACQNIKSLRSHFAAGTLIVYNLQADFTSIKAALRAGTDHCFGIATHPSEILAKLIDLCSEEEEVPFRVLVVEDSITASMAIQRTLKQSGIESRAVADPGEILNGLRSYQPDLVLMDMFMPKCTGVEATRVIRQHPEFLSTPIIYLSGEGDMGLQVDALRLGGEYFLTKPFNPVFLNAVVKSKIERYRALRRSMQHDGLTGLLNHRAIKDRLASAIHLAARTNGLLSVAMIDIDHFKHVNDKYGHPIGDQVIRGLAWLLKQRLRKSDLVGRYGGEEFLVVLPDSNAFQAQEILERIREDFATIKHALSDQWFEASFSTGVSAYPAITCPESLIKDADAALYEAKQLGRNRIVARG